MKKNIYGRLLFFYINIYREIYILFILFIYYSFSYFLYGFGRFFYIF